MQKPCNGAIMQKPLALLTGRKLGPLFVTQFLGAANDNLFKNAMVILVIYRFGGVGGVPAAVMGTLATAALILPFFLFSATAGQLADRFDKARLIRLVKAAEIGVMALAAIGFVGGHPWFLMAMLFLLGTQAAFFGPLKYAILPELLERADLVTGNALIEAGTFVAILLGTIAGGLLVMLPGGPALVAAALVGLAVVGWLAGRQVPMGVAAAPELKIGWNIVAETNAIIGQARKNREVFRAILALSWFWLVGAIYLSQFAAFAKQALNADNQVVTFFLAEFSIGVGLGSMLCSRLLKGEISLWPLPAAALAITVFSLDFALAAAGAMVPGAELIGLGDFLGRWQAWRLVADLAMVALAGGVYAVPLYALIQARSDDNSRARMIAANNVVNALFMAAGAGATALLLAAGLSVAGIFVVLALANAGVAALVCLPPPEQMLKFLARLLLRLVFRVEIRGWETLAGLPERAIIVVNHVSLLDPVLLAAFLPGRPTFAVNARVARWWWVAPFLRVVDTYPLEPGNPMSVKALVRAVEQGRRLVIFPEGRITVTGGLMKVYDGPGMIADRTNAVVVPIRIEGAELTLLSYLKGKVRRRLAPRITLTMRPPRPLAVPDSLRGRARRRAAGEFLFDLMTEIAFTTTDLSQTLPQALFAATARHGGGVPALEDTERKPVGRRRLLLGALVLGRALAKRAEHGDIVGVLLPNVIATGVTVVALQLFGRVPAMLNFTAGPANLVSACAAGPIRLVVTSRRFIEMARLEEVVARLSTVVDVLYLEDLRAGIGRFDRLRGLASQPFVARIHRRYASDPDAPAVVLFTSGSEGAPKGVVLSHRNLLANCRQMLVSIDVNASDSILAALPLFHSFGLMGGLVLPLLAGVKSLLYPSPLHYRQIPEMVYDSNATILFGTDTFLAGYGKAAHPLDFRSLRWVFVGAERLREETRELWGDKFGLRLMEGYGATETAPVLAVGTPLHFKPGTVGRFLPGIAWRLEPVEGIAEGGRLWVAGPNVMRGYLKADRPGEIQPPPDGWYDTGDIVAVDGDGFVTVRGRLRRFAKIAGEMISLAAVEEAVTALWPDFQHAVLALPDAKKGERLVLVTTAPELDRAALAAGLKGRGLSELAMPRGIERRERLPVLGSGKVDYVGLGKELGG